MTKEIYEEMLERWLKKEPYYNAIEITLHGDKREMTDLYYPMQLGIWIQFFASFDIHFEILTEWSRSKGIPKVIGYFPAVETPWGLDETFDTYKLLSEAVSKGIHEAARVLKEQNSRFLM